VYYNRYLCMQNERSSLCPCRGSVGLTRKVVRYKLGMMVRCPLHASSMVSLNPQHNTCVVARPLSLRRLHTCMQRSGTPGC
jgi:hypothetical protein